MVEIALCLGVIGFALVAIIGIIPLGLQVQQENREDTIVSQDGSYFLEAIRNGAQGLDHLTNHVQKIFQVAKFRQVEATNGPITYGPNGLPDNFATGAQIIGLLSACSSNLYRTEAHVRALTGPATENGLDSGTDIGFKYLLTSQVSPFTNFYTNELSGPLTQALLTNTHEVRLTLRYPLLPNGTCGSGKQVFRALVSGKLQSTPDGYFLQPATFNSLP